jgi:hypothetical protein
MSALEAIAMQIIKNYAPIEKDLEKMNKHQR